MRVVCLCCLLCVCLMLFCGCVLLVCCCAFLCECVCLCVLNGVAVVVVAFEGVMFCAWVVVVFVVC